MVRELNINIEMTHTAPWHLEGVLKGILCKSWDFLNNRAPPAATAVASLCFVTYINALNCYQYMSICLQANQQEPDVD